MRPLILCRERLNRLLHVLDRMGGIAPIRDLGRSHGIWWWEVEQAEKLGWVRVSTNKPATGRPSDVAEILNNCPSAKYPHFRSQIPRDIKFSHRCFAINSVNCVGASSPCGLRMATKTEAYMMAYPACRSRAAASVGASRLMKRMDVRLMRRWLFCEINGEICGNMPWSVTELVEQLEPLGYIKRRHRR